MLTLTPKFELPQMPVRKFSVAEYHQMIAAGILSEDDSVELLEGWIVPKMAHNLLHDSTGQILDDLLRPLLPSGWCLRVQMAITLPDSEPEPDLAIVTGNGRTYRHRHPEPPDISLVKWRNRRCNPTEKARPVSTPAPDCRCIGS